MGQRAFEPVYNPEAYILPTYVPVITSVISRALHREGIKKARVGRIRLSSAGRLFGVTTSTTQLSLSELRDLVLRAAREVDPSAIDLFPKQKWRWVKTHRISLARHVDRGSGGLRKPREELEAENEGLRTPAEIRWLGRVVNIRACFDECHDTAATVVAAVLGEATFSRLCRSGERLQDRRHEVEPFEEERLDAFCSRCCRWGHIGP